MEGTLTLTGRVEDLAEIAVFARDRFPGAAVGPATVLEWGGWTVPRAKAYLDQLVPSGRAAIELCVAGGGFAHDASLRAAIGASLKGRTGAMTKTLNKMRRHGQLPPTVARPVVAIYRGASAGYERSGGFAMPSELVPIFEAALAL
ncbi:MAG TPA: hypothetical protein VNU75_13450 [Acidimicrobiales bacterium]|jgi:hypothetical protein|nr:hypothetical protein [Acidimicrobiales bacterium]